MNSQAILKCNTPQDWEKLVNLLKQSNKAIPTTSLSLLSGIHQVKIDQVLETLQKHGIVRRVTQKTVSYWRYVGGDE